MDKSSTVSIINQYYEFYGDNKTISAEDMDFRLFFNLNLAKSIIQDFGIDKSLTIANIIIAFCKSNELL